VCSPARAPPPPRTRSRWPAPGPRSIRQHTSAYVSIRRVQASSAKKQSRNLPRLRLHVSPNTCTRHTCIRVDTMRVVIILSMCLRIRVCTPHTCIPVHRDRIMTTPIASAYKHQDTCIRPHTSITTHVYEYEDTCIRPHTSIRTHVYEYEDTYIVKRGHIF